MINRPNLRLTLLTAALAATAVSAFAAYEANSTYVPAYQERSVTTTTAIESPAVVAAEEPAIIANEAAIVSDGPAVSAKEYETTRVQATSMETTVVEPSIEVTKPRLTVDQRIQADVMDVLARSTNLSGRIGVVSQDSVVTLTGYTATSGQAWRAGRDARGVQGVRHVVNEIRPRVGGITS